MEPPSVLRGTARAGYRSRMDYRASEMRDNPMCELTPQWAPGWATLNVRSRDCLLVPPMPDLGAKPPCHSDDVGPCARPQVSRPRRLPRPIRRRRFNDLYQPAL